jgi:hypothetical protein
MAPRAASFDGREVGSGSVLHGNVGIGTGKGRGMLTDNPTSDATAVATQTAGLMLLRATSPTMALGIVGDLSWGPKKTYLGGEPADDAPGGPAVAAAFALRKAFRIGDSFRVGTALDLGLASTPLVIGSSPERDTSLLLRGTLVPSMKFGPVVVYANVGVATLTMVPAVVDASQTGVRTSLAATLGLGGSVAVGSDARLGVRITQSGGNDASFVSGELTFAWHFGEAPAPAPPALPVGPPGSVPLQPQPMQPMQPMQPVQPMQPIQPAPPAEPVQPVQPTPAEAPPPPSGSTPIPVP